MIISNATAHTVNTAGYTEPLQRRCLARRGMLHSECEAVDHVRLGPSGAAEGTGRDGVDEVWFVLSGELHIGHAAEAQVLRPGAALLSPAGRDDDIRAGAAGAECLTVVVLPRSRVAHLPDRRPELTAPPAASAAVPVDGVSRSNQPGRA
jgi:mannose-6-phosphate isomerase-like protein (cupin superfamily)